MVGMILIFIGMFVLGIVAGYPLGVMKHVKKPIGNLRVDRSDPTDSPNLFLELEEASNVDKLVHMDEAVFRVIQENYVKDIS